MRVDIMRRNVRLIGTFFGLLSVVLGAFGAHAFKALLEASNRVGVYDTAVKYLMFHALVLLVIGFTQKSGQTKWNKIAGYMFVGGTILFSGSLFLMCFLDLSAIGVVTPIGGVLLVIGWISLLISIIKDNKES